MGILQSILRDKRVTFYFHCVTLDIASLLQNILTFLGHRISHNTISSVAIIVPDHRDV